MSRPPQGEPEQLADLAARLFGPVDRTPEPAPEPAPNNIVRAEGGNPAPSVAQLDAAGRMLAALRLGYLPERGQVVTDPNTGRRVRF